MTDMPLLNGMKTIAVFACFGVGVLIAYAVILLLLAYIAFLIIDYARQDYELEDDEEARYGHTLLPLFGKYKF